MYHTKNCAHKGGSYRKFFHKYLEYGIENLDFIEKFKVIGYINENQFLKLKCSIAFDLYEITFCPCCQNLNTNFCWKRNAINLAIENLSPTSDYLEKGFTIPLGKISEYNTSSETKSYYSEIPLKDSIHNMIQYSSIPPDDDSYLSIYNANKTIIENFFDLPINKVNKLNEFKLNDLLIKKFQHDTRKQQKSIALYF